MRKIHFLTVFFLLVAVNGPAQTITQKLQKAYQQFEADQQLKHASSSLYVINAKTGKVVFSKNSQIGLAPASTQKIITAASAFEMLGKNYRFKTVMSYDSRPFELKNRKLSNRIYIEGYGDPALGSFRFSSENKNQLFDSVLYYIRKAGIDTLGGGIHSLVDHFDVNSIPDGWIWQDIGNYYGAAHWPLNWRENQIDIILSSPRGIGESVEVVEVVPRPPDFVLSKHIKSAKKGSGDNTYVYLPVGKDVLGKAIGTIPEGEDAFKISAAVPFPPDFLIDSLRKFLVRNGIVDEEKSVVFTNNDPEFDLTLTGEIIYTHYSPSLDSIVYWFLQKSVNLYGEALIKIISYEKTEDLKVGTLAKGIELVRNFWKQKGIEENELNMCDGSGLSPQNRITTHAQVEVLKYAKKQPWFSSFYNALPEYNNMKIKSGSIRDVKGFCGYHKAKDGNEYIFSFLVNNYNGPASSLVNKMYRVLDVLK